MRVIEFHLSPRTSYRRMHDIASLVPPSLARVGRRPATALLFTELTGIAR